MESKSICTSQIMYFLEKFGNRLIFISKWRLLNVYFKEVMSPVLTLWRNRWFFKLQYRGSTYTSCETYFNTEFSDDNLFDFLFRVKTKYHFFSIISYKIEQLKNMFKVPSTNLLSLSKSTETFLLHIGY